MKLHILFDFKPGPQAGGHNFLRALREEWIARGIWAETPERADGILLNSHHRLDEAIDLRRRFPSAVFLLRIDGPMRIYNHDRDDRDDLVAIAARYLADGLIYQSEWSRRENERLYGFAKPGTVILNAPDPRLFSPFLRTLGAGEKLRILTTGWSANPNKGGRDLEWADRNLDFSDLDWTLLGNAGVPFRNIRALPPVPAGELAKGMRERHLFVFPSRFEACSNALLEAIHSGMPTLAYRGSSNVELVRDDRLRFSSPEELAEKIRFVRAHYAELAARPLELPVLSEVATRYADYFALIAARAERPRACPLRARIARVWHPLRRRLKGGRR